jgi:hypothetical protein
VTYRRGFAGIGMGERAPKASQGRTLVGRADTDLLARGLWVAIVILALAEGATIVATLRASAPDQWGFRGNEALLALAWGSIGALIAIRRPGNRIGWLLLALSLINAFQGVVDQYPALAAALRLPGAEWARWVSAWIWVIPSTGFLTFVPLMFPDGRLLSPRWRTAVLLGFAAMAVLVGTIVLSIHPLGPLAPSANVNPYLGSLGPTTALGFGLYLAAATTGVGSVVLRCRRAAGVERQQVKWVAYAMVFVVMGAAAGTSPILIGQLFFMATVLLTAVAVGIAILRYRLYEIDLIINRTLVYGALSAILAGIYMASMTLSQRLFIAVSGDRSDAAIVFTTLILGATFTPLKTRLQSVVDGRVKPVAPAAIGTAGSAAVGELMGAAEERLREIAREEIARLARGGRIVPGVVPTVSGEPETSARVAAEHRQPGSKRGADGR